METRKLASILRASIDPNQRTDAEEQLNQIHKIIGFAPSLLQTVMLQELDMPVRQAGAIYLKNLISQSWVEQEIEPGAVIPFSIHEQDRGLIRDAIVEALIHSPDLIRLQLAVCINTIVKHDFPGRWTQIVDKIHIYLQNTEVSKIYGALLCLYHLVKHFEYKKAEQREPIDEVMKMILPVLYDLMIRLLPDSSEPCVNLQKQILKIFFAFVQFVLPLDVVNKEAFSNWMELLRQVVDRPVPEETNAIDEDDRADLSWWKCKKWALHILVRVFERYGSPGNVTKEYKSFASWYLKTFSAGIIETLLRLLDRKRRNEYIAPKVLQETLSYLNTSISHAHSWSFLKVPMFGIIQEIIYPIMCHTEEDEELWADDPQEYIREKFNSYEDFASAAYSAQTLLYSACQKRKQILPKTIQFVLQVLQTPNVNPTQKDGALHMIGSVADLLYKKEMYKNEVEKMLFTYVYPEFSSAFGYLRARACWTLCHFTDIKFKDERILKAGAGYILHALVGDKELRVKMEASVTLQSLISYQESCIKIFEPHIRTITIEVLNIIRETKNDDTTNVLQKIICTYQENLSELAVEICNHLAATFSQVIEGSADSDTEDERSITAMSILNTIETLLSVMEDYTGVVAQVRPIVLQVTVHILTESIMEFFEEALSLVYELTCKEIAPELWKVLEIIYELFQKEGADYFMDMMPALHNYVTVDTEAFLSNENYLLAIFNMCKTVLTDEMGEDPESHAAKLLEVIILQCRGRIDQCIPIFVELVLRRLTREIKTSELRIMCLQVVIAALYYNPQLLLETLSKLQLPVQMSEPILSHFIRQWLHDTDCFLGLHDRKICVLGLCTLMMLPEKPHVLNECAEKLIPSLILLFQGLKRAYAIRAQETSDDSDSDEEGSESDTVEDLSSDEDDPNLSEDYLESLQDRVKKMTSDSPFNISTSIKESTSDEDSDIDDDYEAQEETPLESYTTPLDEEDVEIDEYVCFKDVLLTLKEREPSFYVALTSNLNNEQQSQLEEIVTLADKRKAAAESKKIEQGGGFIFKPQPVPKSFNFGGSPIGH